MATTNLKRQSNGVPNHVASLGSTYTDINTGIRYVNADGSTTWNLDVAGSTDTYVTGFTYDNSGNNGYDGTSSGYDGITARLSLIAKSWTVTL